MKAKYTGSHRRRQAQIIIPIVALLTAALMAASVNGNIGKVQTVIMLVSAGVYLYSFSSLLGKVWTSGMVPLMLCGAFAFCGAAGWQRISASPTLMTLFVIGTAVFALALAVTATVSAGMIRASLNTPKKGDRLTVIVLGCKVKGSRPSLMLKGRLDAAAKYLKSAPESMCIVSGGRGDDEQYTEAEIMREYLISLGIDGERIIEENRSFSTAQNIANSIEIIDSLSLDRTVGIATDRFHQYRAALLARRCGVDCRAINRETKWYLAVQYWLREIAGIIMLMFSSSHKNAGR